MTTGPKFVATLHLVDGSTARVRRNGDSHDEVLAAMSRELLFSVEPGTSYKTNKELIMMDKIVRVTVEEA